jgi:hypothetical protein
MKRNLFITLVSAMILVLVLMGCSSDSKNTVANSTAAQDSTVSNDTVSTADSNNMQKDVIDDFNALIATNPQSFQVLAFLSENIEKVSKDEASKMVLKLEEVQKAFFPELEDRFINDDEIGPKLNDLLKPEYNIDEINDIDSINKINDAKLKQLLLDTQNGGYKVDMAEGMFYPVIDYSVYKKFGSYLTDDIKDFIDLMAVESNKAPAKDAALVISWDEVLNRALNQEKFLSTYPDSLKLSEIKALYLKYVFFSLFGLNNTPAFSYDTKQMQQELRNSYEAFLKVEDSSVFRSIIKSYNTILSESSYKLTDDVEKFGRKIIEDLK